MSSTREQNAMKSKMQRKVMAIFFLLAGMLVVVVVVEEKKMMKEREGSKNGEHFLVLFPVVNQKK